MYGIDDFTFPIAGKYRITSQEGYRKSGRTTNGARMSSYHPSIDIAGPVPGSKPVVRNVTGGTVVFAGGNRGRGYGTHVIVKNPAGYLVQYGHLDKASVKVGDVLPPGAPIGIMGATGNATGVHLDLSVVDPQGYAIARDGRRLKKSPAVVAKAAASGIKVASAPKAAAPGSAPPAPALAQGEPEGDDEPMQVAASTPPPSPPPQIGIPPAMPVPTLASGPNAQVDFGASLFGNLGAPSAKSGDGLDAMFALKSGTGVALPTSSAENELFGKIAGMGLGGSLESIYAEAARAIASIKRNLDNRPMVQLQDPLRSELGSIFDNINV